MSDSFIDSNVFVYLVDERDERKSILAEDLVHRSLKNRDAVISHQVVQETLHVLTQKLPVPLLSGDAGRFLTRFLLPMWQVMPTQDLFQRALDIQERYQYHFYDALIVAAALVGGCSRLYSEDLQNGQRISGLTIINPFLD